MHTTYTCYDSPVGPILLAGDSSAITTISFQTGTTAKQHAQEWETSDDVFENAKSQLDAYFAGTLTKFDLNIRPAGTAFQLAVWAALQQIPYGQTCAYSDIADAIGKPDTCRAVGAANHLNPIPIVIPCHRVIGKDGSLVGFGGGLALKDTLLRLENADCVKLTQQHELF